MIRVPPLYILEDHGRLKDPTLNPLFYIYYPTFAVFHPSCCLMHLSARFIGVLGSLANPRTTLGMLLHDGSPREVFPGLCGGGRLNIRPNQFLDQFS